MDQTIQIFNRVLPIILLILLGFVIRHKRFLTETTIDELRKIVVNLALPAVLFTSFLNIELKWSFLTIFLVIFVLNILLFAGGKTIGRKFFTRYSYFPYLTTGFEYGMLGISLFGGAYGIENIGYIAIVDLGHEIFIWFVLLPLLLIKRDGAQNLSAIVKSFLSAPVVLAILASITLNLTGSVQFLYEKPITGGIMTTLEFLGSLTVPLILIIVGYGIRFNRQGFSDALALVAIRLGFLIPCALVLNIYLLRGYLQLDKSFEIALFTLFILPPPFIIPLYARRDIHLDEKQYINNVLTLHTVFTIIVFITYFMLNPIIR